ncbi:MAG: adenylyl-sulfate kinase [Lachnospiraceae bacterium]|nr:adenylyl-sulfate kinase [Lachnospiraceae bacterium]
MKGLLKFITCGSVDDGKSTLIGHMLYDAKLIFADQKKALELDSKVGSVGGEIDYSLLLDGLMAEREQGITIDVAYRYFTTNKRSFIVADTPGHEEYTRNMAVGASFADLAVILVDASKGVLIQTKRHTRICALMGIKNVVFAVNKMDTTGYDRDNFNQLKEELNDLCKEHNFESVYSIPVSATVGDNLTGKSENTPWYKGKSLLDYLETIDVTENEGNEDFILPVQRVCRPDRNFRGFQGQISGGCVSVGDTVTVLPSGEKAGVKQILVTDKDVNEAHAGEAVNIQLDREIDISRGCVITDSDSLILTNLFRANLLWMDDDKLVEGKSYYLKLGTRMVPATVMKIKYLIDVNEGHHIKATRLNKNEIASCEISLSEKIVMDKFENNRDLGSFILIDRVTNMTAACGIVCHDLRRGNNLVWHEMKIDRQIRSASKNQTPKTLWFTGLSGSGKSTLVNEIEQRFVANGKHTMVLDGDNIRLGINKDLGFEEEDRIENIRRVAHICKLMNDAGLIVFVSLVSPYEKDRERAKEIIGEDSFVEIYVSTTLEECEKRDVKGLYKKAREGKIPNFTGIGNPYEAPKSCDIEINTTDKTIEQCVSYVIEELEKYEI